MKTKLLILISMLLVGSAFAQIPTNGLIAKYDLENSNLNDSSTGAINFTQAGNLGTASNDRFNTTNAAYKLNNDYLTRSDLDYNLNHGNLNAGVNNTVSYAFWIKTDEVSSDRKTIIDDSERSVEGYAGKEAGYFIHLTDGKIGVNSRVEYNNNEFNQASTAVAGLSLTYPDVIADGNWHHVIVKLGQYHSGSTSGQYYLRSSISIDGGEIQTAIQNFIVKFYITKYTNTVGNVVIGNNRAENLLDANRYEDEIDEVLIYNRALTTAERTAIYTNRGATCTAPLSNAYEISSTNDLTELKVSILDSKTYDIAYVETGNAFSTATIVYGKTLGDTIITGLNTGTTYDVYLREECSSGNVSDWSLSNLFKTNEVVYVNHAATGNNDGSTWANAYVNVYDALSSNISTDQQIWVASGTYKPNTTLARDATFLFDKPINIYGGFSGVETKLEDRNVLTNVTTLSGDLNGDDNAVITDVESTRQDNSYHVITLKGNFGSVKPVIDGFTISGGNANGGSDIACSTPAANQYLHYRAAAIYVNPDAAGAEINVAIKNCIIENNSATGMAVYVTVSPCGITGTTTDVDFEHTIIRNNYTISHANIYYNGSGTYNNIRNGSLINCLAYANHSTNDSSVLALTTSGGASSSTVLIYGTTMSKNTSNRVRGGVVTPSVIRTNGASNSIMANSIIYDNGSNYPIDNSSGTTILYKYNSIIQAQTGTALVSNANPQFTDSANYDFTLQATSPAKDTGNNTYATAPTDLLGNHRVFNTTVDMGPYEFGSSVGRSLTTSSIKGTISADVQPVNGLYTNGTVVMLTATPDTGYQFDGWSGDATGNTNPLSVTMDADKSITAAFSLIPVVQHTLTINATNGTVATNPNPTNGTYDEGTVVGLTATPASGYQFDGWSGDASGATTSVNVTMDADKTVTATFSLIQRTLTINATNGTVATNPNPTNGTYDNGTVVGLTATPAAGYQFDGWSGDATGTTNPLSITMDADKTVTAIFSQIQRTLNVTIVGNGTVTLASGSATNGTYADGTVLSLVATPDAGYGFTGFTGDATGTTSPFSITMDADKNITATFSATASVNDINRLDFEMYPNPTKGNLTFGLQEEVKTIELFNLQGQVVQKFRTKKINISSVAKGIYLVKITTTDGKQAIKKVVKN